MKKILKQIVCKHEFHNRGVFDVCERGIRKKKNISKCFKCGKVKTTTKVIKYSLDKVRL